MGVGKETDYIIENLAVLLASGMGILPALNAIRLEIRSKTLRKVLDRIYADIEDGASLSQALEDSGLVPAYITTLIHIGEQSGQLQENLQVITIQEQKDRMLTSKVRSAMMYPVLVLFLTAAIGLGIAWFILPRLAAVFSNLRLELPFLTKILITVGSFLGDYGLLVIPGLLILGALCLYLIFVYPKTNHVGQWILLRLPAISSLIQEIELTRLGYILGNLLNAGLPIVEAVGLLATASNFHAYKNFYALLSESLEEGNSFQKTFEYNPQLHRLIPTPVQQIIISGEQSGHLAESLLHIGKTFEEKTDITTKNLTVILEPLLLVIVWSGVVLVALAVILPLYRLLGGLE